MDSLDKEVQRIKTAWANIDKSGLHKSVEAIHKKLGIALAKGSDKNVIR